MITKKIGMTLKEAKKGKEQQERDMKDREKKIKRNGG